MLELPLRAGRLRLVLFLEPFNFDIGMVLEDLRMAGAKRPGVLVRAGYEGTCTSGIC
jgi:hypothetical protein